MAASPIIKEIFIQAPPETVLELLTDETKIKRWLTGSVMKASAKANRNVRVMFKGEEVHQACLTISLDKLLAASFSSKNAILEGDGCALPSVIEIDVRPEGSGTRLTLTHARQGRNPT